MATSIWTCPRCKDENDLAFGADGQATPSQTCATCGLSVAVEVEAPPPLFSVQSKPKTGLTVMTVVFCTLAAVGIFGLALVLWAMISNAASAVSAGNGQVEQARSAAETQRYQHRIAVESFRVTDIRWKKAGNFLSCSFTLNNNSIRPVSDIKLRFSMVAETGTVIHQVEKVFYKRVSPDQPVEIYDADIGFVDPQMRSLIVSVVDLVSE